MHDHMSMAMNAEFTYAMAFMMGILGSGHCLGMCGSLVSGFFLRFPGGQGMRVGLMPVAAYHFSRIGIYILIGIVAAMLGAVLVQSGQLGTAQGILQLLAGVIVIVLGLDILGLLPFRISVNFLPTSWTRGLFRSATRKGAVAGASMGGVVNGLMPCSMTLAVAVQATTASGVTDGGLMMLAFGLGTLPAMVFVSVVFGRLGAHIRGILLKVAALFVIGLGLATLYQGVGNLQRMAAPESTPAAHGDHIPASGGMKHEGMDPENGAATGQPAQPMPTMDHGHQDHQGMNSEHDGHAQPMPAMEHMGH